MANAGCPGSVRKCPGVALADLGDTEGFDKDGEENQLYGFQLSDKVYKRIKVRQEGIGSLKFEELGDVDIAYAVPKRHHMLAFAGGKWFPFADPVQQMGWLIDIRIFSPYIVTGNQQSSEDRE